VNKQQIYWARVTSNLLSPPLVWAVMAFPIAFRDAATNGQAILWALTYGVLVCLIPVLYVLWMVRRGSISDLHMKVRQERLRPFMVSILCTLMAWWTLWRMGAPPVLPMVAAFTLAQLSVMTIITLVWQISFHAMCITGAVVAAGVLFGPAPALVASPLIPLVGAARLRLRRHTLSQVVAGAVVGALITIVLFAVF
jgi:membrane-associated phospholipid phosphatase